MSKQSNEAWIDDIILKPAHWNLGDYSPAKQLLLQKFRAVRLEALSEAVDTIEARLPNGHNIPAYAKEGYNDALKAVKSILNEVRSELDV